MKNIFVLFFSMLLLSSNLATAQTADGGCSTVSVTEVPPFPTVFFSSVGYKNCKDVGNFESCDQDGQEACCRIITSGNPTTPRFWLEQLQGNGTWLEVQGPQFNTTFSGLSEGLYRVKCQIPVIAENACLVDELGNVEKARICLFDPFGGFLGHWGTWDNAPFGQPLPTFSNTVAVGSPVPVISVEETYCCKKDVVLNTAGTTGEDQHYISICQINPTGGSCINWRSTGWLPGKVDPTVDLLDIWNQQGASDWIFWPNNSYRVMLALRNECDDWEATTKTFEVLSIDPSFVINDADGDPVPDNGDVCKSVRDVTMDASVSSCGDEYLIMICQVDPAGGACLNWRSTDWTAGDVSTKTSIDLLSIWNRDGASDWLFWTGKTFRVSLILRDECDTWEGYNQTFTVDGTCFTGGGGDDRDQSTLEQFGTDSKVQIYPTLINSSVNYLTVLVSEEFPNATLLLYDAQGRVMQQNQISDQSSEISIQELGAGLYFAILYENGKPIHQSKLVVSK